MTEHEQIKNIIAFLLIIFGENEILSNEIMNLHPEYLIEKFNRYILSNKSESEWGLHPFLRRRLFDRYCEKWEIENEII